MEVIEKYVITIFNYNNRTFLFNITFDDHYSHLVEKRQR